MIKNIIFLCLFILINVSVFAQEYKPLQDKESFISELKKASAETQTIQSDFIQEKYLSVMSEKIESKGTFSFKKENKLRWEYSEPLFYMIVINGSTMYMKDEEKVSNYDMESNKMFKEINKMMVGMVQGDILSTTDFTYKYFENDKEYYIVLNPARKEMKEFMRNIEIYLDKSNFTVNKIVMKESGEDYTEITFLNKKVNENIPDSRFQVK